MVENLLYGLGQSWLVADVPDNSLALEMAPELKCPAVLLPCRA